MCDKDSNKFINKYKLTSLGEEAKITPRIKKITLRENTKMVPTKNQLTPSKDFFIVAHLLRISILCRRALIDSDIVGDILNYFNGRNITSITSFTIIITKIEFFKIVYTKNNK